MVILHIPDAGYPLVNPLICGVNGLPSIVLLEFLEILQIPDASSLLVESLIRVVIGLPSLVLFQFLVDQEQTFPQVIIVRKAAGRGWCLESLLLLDGLSSCRGLSGQLWRCERIPQPTLGFPGGCRDPRRRRVQFWCIQGPE
jgi:hypothetical protein